MATSTLLCNLVTLMGTCQKPRHVRPSAPNGTTFCTRHTSAFEAWKHHGRYSPVERRATDTASFREFARKYWG